MPIAKEQIRQIISENNITSVADVYSLLRDSFKDILQELMEAEMDATLGYFSICLGDENRGLRAVLFFLSTDLPVLRRRSVPFTRMPRSRGVSSTCSGIHLNM